MVGSWCSWSGILGLIIMGCIALWSHIFVVNAGFASFLVIACGRECCSPDWSSTRGSSSRFISIIPPKCVVVRCLETFFSVLFGLVTFPTVKYKDRCSTCSYSRRFWGPFSCSLRGPNTLDNFLFWHFGKIYINDVTLGVFIGLFKYMTRIAIFCFQWLYLKCRFYPIAIEMAALHGDQVFGPAAFPYIVSLLKCCNME